MIISPAPTLSAPALPEWLSVSQLCGKYQISRTTLWRWAKTPGFPQAVSLGRVMRWDALKVDAFLSQGLSAEDLCTRYQISRTTFWRWTKRPGFPAASGIGRMQRWSPQAIDAFLARTKRPATEQHQPA